MKQFVFPILLGAVLGIVDVIPMIKMKIDNHSIISAFVFHLIMPLILYNIAIESIPWWLKGAIIYFICAIPIVILVAKNDMKSVPIILVSSIVLGTISNVVLHYFN